MDLNVGAVVLFVQQGDVLYRTWKDLPSNLQEYSIDGGSVENPYLFGGALVRKRAQDALLEDYVKRNTAVGPDFGPNGLFNVKGVPSDCLNDWLADLNTGFCEPKDK